MLIIKKNMDREIKFINKKIKHTLNNKNNNLI